MVSDFGLAVSQIYVGVVTLQESLARSVLYVRLFCFNTLVVSAA